MTVKAALIGAGSRGMFAYGSYSLEKPHEIQFVAVAEPDPEKRSKFAGDHQVKAEYQFESWEELLEEGKICDVLLICTSDDSHYESAMKALEAGYDILLEKPMSPNPEEALAMAEKAEKEQRILSVCHVLRYSTFFTSLKNIVETTSIGDIIAVDWTENIGYWHFAHSFVRGNWSKTETSSPIILAKCCHDMDMIQYILDDECEEVFSYGDLAYFREENAPEGATERCTDGCPAESDCLYSALKWYYNGQDAWPQNVVSLSTDLSDRWEALTQGPYGKCVYRADNDVADHQTVSMAFKKGTKVSFTMSAFTKNISRHFKLMGTKGEITGDTLTNEIRVRKFSGHEEVIYPEQVAGGHGGADKLIMRDFIRQVKDQRRDGRTSALLSAESHLIAFAAEESRQTDRPVKLSRFKLNLTGKTAT